MRWAPCSSGSLLRHALSHSGFRYAVLCHQNSHGVSHQTARSDLQKLASRGLLLPGKGGRREIFRVPEDLTARLDDLPAPHSFGAQ